MLASTSNEYRYHDAAHAALLRRRRRFHFGRCRRLRCLFWAIRRCVASFEQPYYVCRRMDTTLPLFGMMDQLILREGDIAGHCIYHRSLRHLMVAGCHAAWNRRYEHATQCAPLVVNRWRKNIERRMPSVIRHTLVSRLVTCRRYWRIDTYV